MGGPIPRPLEERFWAKVEKADGCWLWIAASKTRGYGNIYVSPGRTALAHRVAWELMCGAIPDDLQVLHKCDNPPCCNPAHLFLGSQKDNIDDAWTKGRMSKPPTTKPGHAPKVLSPEKVRALRARRAEGASYNVLAGEFGIAMTTVRDVVKGYIWGHVK